MDDLLLDVQDTARVIRAVEDNVADYLLLMGKLGGGEEKRTDAIHWTIGGSTIDYHNAIVRANLSPQTADAAIDEVIERLQHYHVPGTWHLSPSMTPDNLGERLLARGFVFAGDEPGMAAYLPDLVREPLPDGLTITRVQDENALNTWAKTLASGFGEGENEAFWVRDVFLKLGFADDSSCRHYLGWLNGEPVATSSVFFSAGVAGIYFVFTALSARRRGIGAALTLAPLYDAVDLGYRVAVLGSSAAGLPVYQRIGFQTVCNFKMYEWHRS